jgi:serine O-acetyltransferase
MRENMNSKNISELVSEILESYRREDTLIKIKTEEKNQISKSVIVDIINNLRSLIFAGFFSRKPLKSDSLEYYAGELLEDIGYNLRKQIARALGHTKDSAQKTRKRALTPDAADITYAFLKKIPDIRTLLKADIEATFDGDPAAFNKDEIILSYPGIYAIMVNRLAHELHLLDVPLIPRMMSEHAHTLTGIDIHPGASIGNHFFIDHGTGIVIGETTVIGNHVKIYQGVTLGALSTRGGQMLSGVKRHPTIEDFVTIYAGASILGGATVIGEGVVIGSNTFITKSVPEKTRVSVKNPELQYKSNEKAHVELTQEEFWDYVI